MKPAKDQMHIITRTIEDGRTGYGEQIIGAFESLNGKRAEIIIREFKPIRTTFQNAYYWAVPLKMYREYFAKNGVLMSNDDMHLWIKEYVWGDFIDITVNDIPFRKILTSTLLTVQEWEERMESTRAYAAVNFRLQIPEPREKLPAYIEEWFEMPEGVYYDARYTEYFQIEKPKDLIGNNQ